MRTHMKTTVELPDALLEEAKRVAAEEVTTHPGALRLAGLAGHPRRDLRGPRRVIAADTNILVYAHRKDAPLHASAAEAVRGLAEGRAVWAIPWPCMHEFISVVTHPGIYATPTAPAAAIDQVRAWAESPSFRPLGETTDHLNHLERLVLGSAVQGPEVHDARVAAICQANGVRELWSLDRDLTRFPSLRVVNPLG